MFLSDVKGDLAGLAQAGRADHKLHEAFLSRAATIGFDDFAYAAAPVTFWDLYGQKGHPVRTTISEMGPLLLARLLELTEAQEGVLKHRLPCRRRRRDGAARSQGPSGAPGLRGRSPQRI